MNKTEYQKLVMEFFKKNPAPFFYDVACAINKEFNNSTNNFIMSVRDLMGGFFGAGLSRDYHGVFDEGELKEGTRIEMEHTINPLIAERIAMDHLAEIPDYYTRLKKMEEEAKIELNL